MKLTAVFLLAVSLQVTARTYSQKVTLNLHNAPLAKAIKEVRKQTGLSFLFNNELVKDAGKVTVNIQDASLDVAMSKILANTGLSFKLVDHTIVISPQLLTTETNPDLPQTVKKEILVTGKIVNADGKPLPGVSVLNKNSNKGTSSDSYGFFTIMANEQDLIEFSFVGYKSQVLKVTGDMGPQTIKLEIAVVEMSDMVVVGYGQVSKKDNTGAVSSIKGAELNKVITTNFEAALVGRAPGVHVVRSSGAPGAIATIRIRGGTSAIGTNEPLYVIDGIPVEMGDGFGNAAFQEDSRNKLSPLAAINPADIEAIDILKDASSTAIYGSRAANGVVMVTTKRGKKGDKLNIVFDHNSSFDRFVKQYNMLGADQYHDVVKQAYQNGGQNLPATYIAYPDANTDWVNKTTRTAVSNNTYLNINGGSSGGNTLYSFSGGLTKQNGAIRHTDYLRQTLKTSLTTLLFDKLRLGTNINLSLNENNGSGTGIFYVLSNYRPDVPVYDSHGNFGAAPDSVNSNPVARINQISKLKSQSVLSSFFGEVELLKGLWYRSSISITLNKGTNERYTPSTDVFEIRNGRRGSRNDYISTGNSRIFDNTLTYTRRIKNHALNLMSGASFTKTRNEYTSISSVNFQDDQVLNNLGSAGSIQTYSSGGGISGLSSYFLRSNYNFKSKYYATFTGRADHSTKFGPHNRWGYFPSGALAWRISSEKFMGRVSFVNDLKLRVSYGKTGSANFSDFQYATFFGSGSFYFGNNGVAANTVPNPAIKWETTYQFDATLEYNLFFNKLRGSIGYFQKTTRGMILNRQIIRETGGSTQFANMGDFLNKGWELQIGSDVVNKKDFAFYTDINLTRYRSKVLKLNEGSYLNLREGEPIGYFTGYKVDGIFQSQQDIDALNAKSPNGIYQSSNTKPGDFRFVDINNDGIINTSDISVIGKAEPDFYGGWNNIVRFKNLEMTAFFNFSAGNSLYNSGRRSLIFFASNTSNYAEEIVNAWRPDNTGAILPRVVVNDPNRNSRDSDFFIEKASFLKLKNLQLSYILRDNFLRKLFITDLRAYASVSNVFVITKYKGLDPEVNTAPSNNFSQGYDSNVYPTTRTLTIGITANF